MTQVAEINSGDINVTQKHLCFVGNMLGRNAGYITTQGEILADLFTTEGYKITCVSSKINRAARLAEIVKTLVKGCRAFDIVLLDTYSGLSFVIADITSFLCKCLNLRLVMVLHGGNLPEFVQKHPRWARRVLNRAAVLVAPSEFLAKRFETLGYRIPIIPNIIDLDSYPFRERSRISPNLIWMRSFHEIYNPEMAVRVLANLRATHPDATLIMAGTDKGLEDGTRLLVDELGLKGSVRFAGFLDLDKKLKEFAGADIYINTTRIDNMPVSVVEARALGLPVVATDVGGLPYLIEHGTNGFLVPDEDVDAMAACIQMLLDSPELTRKISRNGRTLAERSAWTSVRPMWEKLIGEVIQNKTPKNAKVRGFSDKFSTEKIRN